MQGLNRHLEWIRLISRLARWSSLYNLTAYFNNSFIISFFKRFKKPSFTSHLKT